MNMLTLQLSISYVLKTLTKFAFRRPNPTLKMNMKKVDVRIQCQIDISNVWQTLYYGWKWKSGWCQKPTL